MLSFKIFFLLASRMKLVCVKLNLYSNGRICKKNRQIKYMSTDLKTTQGRRFTIPKGMVKYFSNGHDLNNYLHGAHSDIYSKQYQ